MNDIKVGISPLKYEGNNYKYTAKIIKKYTGQELSHSVEEINISLPTSSKNITSMKASFVIEEDLIKTNETITIEVLDQVGNKIYFLTGEAKINSKVIHYTGKKEVYIEVVDELDKLFEKVVSKDTFFFDQWLYNSTQKENSILYKIALELGFTDKNIDFEDIRDTESKLIKIPFMIIREGNKWIDELHTIVDCTRGLLYIENEKLKFKNNIFKNSTGEIEEFNNINIIRSVTEKTDYKTYNGVKLLYDSYKYLPNQVVFDLAEKIEVKANTTPENQKLEFNINYITSIVTHHNLTSAQGYYYENENPVRIDLVEGVHYKFVEFKESKAIVKFFNPYNQILYIDKFEITGIPVAKYEDNKAIAKDEGIKTDNQENFKEIEKNKYIQTEELATNLSKLAYKEIQDKKTFNFVTNFHPGYELGKVYGLIIDDIYTKITLDTININLSRINGFKIDITASEYIEDEISHNISITENQVSKDKYLDDLKNTVDDLTQNQETIIEAIGARGFISEIDPVLLEEKGSSVVGLGVVGIAVVAQDIDYSSTKIIMKTGDVWFKPSTKEFKVWRNGQWNQAREEDIMPSLMTALKAQAGYFTIGGNDVMAGIFFSYDNDPNNPIFGATDTEHLAQVSIDKKANVLIRNANNKLAFNMRNPENPSEIISQLLMGVYNADDPKHNDTLFQVGDESTGTYIKFKRGNLSQIVTNGKDVGDGIGEIDSMKKGNLLINANTIFDGKGTFISSGSNETTVIRDGSISFTRSGETITTIRNMRAGTVSTDGYGSGYVDFIGMKSNLFILPSIKAFDVSANVRSLNCRVEKDPNYLAQNRYKFFIYGTEEVYEGQIKIDSTVNGYTVNAYSAGIESVTLNTSPIAFIGSAGITNSKDDCGINNGKIRNCKIGIKVFISESGVEKYYGETEVIIENIVGTNLFVDNRDYGKVTLRYVIPNIRFQLTNYTCTTQNKNDKRIRVELVIKEKPMCKLYSKNNIQSDNNLPPDYRYTYVDVEIPIDSSKINFINGTYYYSPSHIQNIIGGGEVQYLAIEQ